MAPSIFETGKYSSISGIVFLSHLRRPIANSLLPKYASGRMITGRKESSPAPPPAIRIFSAGDVVFVSPLSRKPAGWSGIRASAGQGTENLATHRFWICMEEKKKMILAVDDALVNLKVIQSALRDEFDVRLAKSGDMALAALGRITPDLVLLDIEMPDMSGFEVMAKLAGLPLPQDMPIIFVTSHSEENTIRQAFQKGAAGYIVKPFSPDLLREKVRQALGMREDAGHDKDDHGFYRGN
jgi:CheY-like chemotaxis protein